MNDKNKKNYIVLSLIAFFLILLAIMLYMLIESGELAKLI